MPSKEIILGLATTRKTKLKKPTHKKFKYSTNLVQRIAICNLKRNEHRNAKPIFIYLYVHMCMYSYNDTYPPYNQNK